MVGAPRRLASKTNKDKVSPTSPTISIDIEHGEGLLEVGNFFFFQISVSHGLIDLWHGLLLLKVLKVSRWRRSTRNRWTRLRISCFAACICRVLEKVENPSYRYSS